MYTTYLREAAAACSAPLLRWSHHWWSLRRFLITRCGCTPKWQHPWYQIIDVSPLNIQLRSFSSWPSRCKSHRFPLPLPPPSSHQWLPRCLRPRVGGETSGTQRQSFHLLLHRPYAASCLAETQLYWFYISVLWDVHFHRQVKSVWTYS
jgi:hypothetical protein